MRCRIANLKFQIANSQARNRRGVLILVVLTLLVMFALMAMTYVLVATKQLGVSRSAGRAGTNGDPPRTLADAALMELVRSSTNPHSPLFAHSLLEDLYGAPLILQAQIPTTPTELVGGIVEFRFTSGSGPTLSPLDGYYEGCLLTMTDGPARGLSTRIVRYMYDSTTTPPEHIFRCMPFKGFTGSPASLQGRHFIINGRAFSGTGFGFDENTGTLVKSTPSGNPIIPDSLPYALLPGLAGADLNDDSVLDALIGGANEDYDAPDYQNLHMAFIDHEGKVILPSFYRPDLINYWKNREGISDWESDGDMDGEPDYQPLLRQIMLRPSPLDHPNFTGSNPRLDVTTTDWQQNLTGWDPGTNSFISPWDIDNDGDGVADSVWLDLGFPVRSTADGRKYKPLVAILCLDLDSRLNVNAHGTTEHIDNPHVNPSTLALTPVPAQPFAGTDVATPYPLPRGDGSGPAEIDLMAAGLPPAELSNLLYGANLGGQDYVGRYGESIGSSAQGGWSPASDTTNAADSLAMIKRFQFPDNSNNNILSAFGSPADLWGRMAVGLDHRGQPLFWKPAWTNETLNSPYDINLSRNASRTGSPSSTTTADNPFTAFDLERILRPWDIDSSSLPSRLGALLGSSVVADARSRITTDSWDLPSPGVIAPRHLRNELLNRRASNVVEMLAAKIQKALQTEYPSWTAAQLNAAVNAQLRRSLSWDLIANRRMNINRPLGDGRDGNDNGVVDEPIASELVNDSTSVWADFPYYTGSATLDLVNGIDVDGDDAVGPSDQLLARQLLARHLYVLARLLIDDDYLPSLAGPIGNVKWFENETPPPTDPQKIELAIRRLAQWAVNVVDFLDPDSISTPFEYDVNPFVVDDTSSEKTWEVDGILGSGSPDDNQSWRRVVWGCERPELLITEIFAFHDRQTEDRDDDSSGNKVEDGDPHFDQRLRPRSGVFVELYNPWTSGRSPGEFYNYNSGANTFSPGVNLNKVNSEGSPVWRLLVLNKDNNDKDPDEPDPANNEPPLAPSTFERTVYFTDITDPIVTAVPAGHGMAYSTNLPVAPLMPGRYAVVGSSGKVRNGKYETPLGRRTGAADGDPPDMTRRIVLAPSTNPNTHQVEIYNVTPGGAVDPPTPNDIQQTIAIAINQPRSLSISEPTTDYPMTGPNGETWDVNGANGEGAYTTPIDQPLDFGDTALMANGTTKAYRKVHLQRLANPLLAWNATTNPYLTIDSMEANLTAFNGVENESTPSNGEGNFALAEGFATNERGAGDPAPRLLWYHNHHITPPNPMGVPTPGDGTHVLDYQLEHSLGYLNEVYNQGYGPPLDQNAGSYAGAPDTTAGPAFPWLTWNNRPFANVAEITLVPASSPGKLSQEFSKTIPNPYSADVQNPQRHRPPFGHLLNLFASSKTAGQAANLSHLLEYLEVPSPFVGTETVLNPQDFQWNGGDVGEPSSSPPGDEPAGTMGFHPPFNMISNYRDPGKVNVNTIAYPEVWNAVLGGNSGVVPGPTFNQLVESRRGYANAGTLYSFDNTYPSIFSNPFRSAAGADMVPNGGGTDLSRKPVEVTLWRSKAISPADTSDEPLFNFTSTQPYNDPTRNPYFTYQALSRVANKLTTRSNVYAVWVTVGYFEVEPHQHPTLPAGANEVYPDGYWLTQELGADSGEIKRHRAFYIIDRSIPVGYERGQNHNVEDCILLRRFIE